MAKIQVRDTDNSVNAREWVKIVTDTAPSADLLLRFSTDSRVHRSMLQTISPNESFEPLIYKVVYGTSSPSINEGPAANALAVVKQKYDELENCLDALAQSSDEGEAVERGAVQTAIEILNQIEEARIPPPKITTQDNEAVIMLWAEGMKRCAITITDGEVGYVVRDNRQLLSSQDSINIRQFKLLGHTPALK